MAVAGRFNNNGQSYSIKTIYCCSGCSWWVLEKFTDKIASQLAIQWIQTHRLDHLVVKKL
jgi:uncharacterized metal-binding protein